MPNQVRHLPSPCTPSTPSSSKATQQGSAPSLLTQYIQTVLSNLMDRILFALKLWAPLLSRLARGGRIEPRRETDTLSYSRLSGTDEWGLANHSGGTSQKSLPWDRDHHAKKNRWKTSPGDLDPRTRPLKSNSISKSTKELYPLQGRTIDWWVGG